jgi:hypothetical protein
MLHLGRRLSRLKKHGHKLPSSLSSQGFKRLNDGCGAVKSGDYPTVQDEPLQGTLGPAFNFDFIFTTAGALHHNPQNSHIFTSEQLSKMSPPFRAEHLGSLLRPKELLLAHAASEKGELSASDVAKVEDASITTVVKVQTDLNFHAITDGEYRRAVFWGTFFEELEGMTEIRNPSMEIFRPYVPDIAGFIEKGHKPGQSCLCTGKIKHKGKSTLVGQFEFLKTLIPEERWGEIKVTMIAPPWYVAILCIWSRSLSIKKNDVDYFEKVSSSIQRRKSIPKSHLSK